MATLHGYILRELLKTTGLALVAMTVLFTMGGGLYNIIRFEGVSAGDLMTIVPLLIPIVLTMSLPIAALFAATMVYGRLAADNELTACKAAGINVHRLFLPAGLLALFVAVFVLLVGNFVIPSFVQQITNYARNNLRDIIAQNLQQEGFLRHREKGSGAAYTVTAERVQRVDERELQDRGFEVGTGLQYLHISNPTFLHVDGSGRLVRFTVANQALCRFDIRPDPMELMFLVDDARDFEVGRQAVHIGQQQIGPVGIPVPAPFQLSFADLRSLLHWGRQPWDVPRLTEPIRDYIRAITLRRFFDHAAEQIARGTLELRDRQGTPYVISGRRVKVEDRGVFISDGRVLVPRGGAAQPTRYEAREATLRAIQVPGTPNFDVELILLRTAESDVLEYEPKGAGRYGEPRRKQTLSFDGLQLPDVVLADARTYTPAAVVDPQFPLPGDERLEERRAGLRDQAAKWQRKVAATIHFRLGYSSCAIVAVVMGAILGVLFRGSRVLAAFGLATIPLFGVLMLMVVGRQLAEQTPTQQLGPLVTWGGLAGVLVLDVVLLRLGVRR